MSLGITMSSEKELASFTETFGGMIKTTLVTIPGMLLPIGNFMAAAIGGTELIPLGQFAAFAGALAPVLSGIMLLVLFGTRRSLEKMLRSDQLETGDKGPPIQRTAVLFVIVPTILALWGVAGVGLMLTETFEPAILHAFVYILSFTFFTLTVGLLAMREYLYDRIGTAGGSTTTSQPQ